MQTFRRKVLPIVQLGQPTFAGVGLGHQVEGRSVGQDILHPVEKFLRDKRTYRFLGSYKESAATPPGACLPDRQGWPGPVIYLPEKRPSP